MGFNPQKLQKIMSDPSCIFENELEELQNAIAEYPYFQLGHTFIAKAKHDQQATDANKSLHLAAIYAPSRRRLKQIFYNENVSGEPAETGTTDTTQHDVSERTSSAEQINEASHDTIYKELEENLQHLRSTRKQSLEDEPENGNEENNKKKTTSKENEEDNSEESTYQIEEVQPENKDESNYHAPYLVDYLKDIEPIQSDRLGINQKHQRELIDKFMNSERDVRIRWRYQAQEPQDLSEKNKTSADNFVTENLADIFVRQGKKDKAIEIYEKLILKNPHKKTYFAEKIESLKEN